MSTRIRAATSPRSREEILVRAVGRLLGRLQGEYLHEGGPPSPWAAATMAGLRRADPGVPETAPASWEITYSALPAELLGKTDAPSAGERAVHAALVLYAVHQASQTRPMNVGAVGVGAALRLLPGSEEEHGPVLRRFTSLLAAATFAETAYQLRSLMTLLRRDDIPLDHAWLARDLFLVQRPDRASGVRMRWGRDFFGSRALPEPESDATDLAVQSQA